jgi:hypothetical protein
MKNTKFLKLVLLSMIFISPLNAFDFGFITKLFSKKIVKSGNIKSNDTLKKVVLSISPGILLGSAIIFAYWFSHRDKNKQNSNSGQNNNDKNPNKIKKEDCDHKDSVKAENKEAVKNNETEANSKKTTNVKQQTIKKTDNYIDNNHNNKEKHNSNEIKDNKTNLSVKPTDNSGKDKTKEIIEEKPEKENNNKIDNNITDNSTNNNNVKTNDDDYEVKILENFFRETNFIKFVDKNSNDFILNDISSKIIKLLLEYGFGSDLRTTKEFFNNFARLNLYTDNTKSEKLDFFENNITYISTYLDWAIYLDENKDKPELLNTNPYENKMREFFSKRLLNKFGLLLKESNEKNVQHNITNNNTNEPNKRNDKVNIDEIKILEKFFEETGFLKSINKDNSNKLFFDACFTARPGVIKLLLEHGLGDDLSDKKRLFISRDFYGGLVNREILWYIRLAICLDESVNKDNLIKLNSNNNSHEAVEFFSKRKLNKYDLPNKKD